MPHDDIPNMFGRGLFSFTSTLQISLFPSPSPSMIVAVSEVRKHLNLEAEDS